MDFRPDLIIPELQRFVEHLLVSRGYSNLKAAYLFGSVLSPADFKETSDVDVALFHPDFGTFEFDRFDDLKMIARDSGLNPDLLDRLDFRLLSDTQLDKPDRFVKHEVLNNGMPLYRFHRNANPTIADLMRDHMTCDSCRTINDAHKKWCRAKSESEYIMLLFALDPRMIQIPRDVDLILGIVEDRADLGHPEHLELALVAWATLKQMVLGNVLAQLVLWQYAKPISLKYAITAHLDSIHFARTIEEAFEKVSLKSWNDLSSEAWQGMGQDLSDRFARAREYRNAYIHSRLPYTDGKTTYAHDVRNFCRSIICDRKFLIEPTIRFSANLYKAAFHALKPEIETALVGKSGARYKVILRNLDNASTFRNQVRLLALERSGEPLSAGEASERERLALSMLGLEKVGKPLEHIVEDVTNLPAGQTDE